MGYRLYREVLDHAPPDLTSGERLVWAVLADFANDTSREAHPGRDALCRRTGMGERGVRLALNRLATRGHELRVPLGKDRNGRPVYAYEGTQSRYRMPILADRRNRGSSTVAEPENRHSTRRDGTTVPERRNHSAAEAEPQFRPSPQEPSENSSSPRVRGGKLAAFAAEHSMTDDEMEIITDRVQSEHQPRNVRGYLATMASNGDLAAMLDEHRAATHDARTRADRRTFIDSLDGRPDCEHGYPGGHVSDERGWVRCPIERRRVAGPGRPSADVRPISGLSIVDGG